LPINLKSLVSHFGVRLRPWTLEDAEFCIYVRNKPELMRYFRQDKPLYIEDQLEFIKEDTGPYGTYNGRIVEYRGKPVGLCGVKDTGEFTLGILPQYQHKGIATKVMQQMIQEHKGSGGIWSEVFVGNPALEWFIGKLGFKVYGVEERAYFKKGIGLINIVRIKHE
jgi:RimJ/RimL family protein N-acetyltransferase